MALAKCSLKYEMAAAERDAAMAGAIQTKGPSKDAGDNIGAELALAYYDNAHALLSNDIIAQQEINAEKKAEPKKISFARMLAWRKKNLNVYRELDRVPAPKR